MALIVQKYGGTSVGTLDRIRNVASRLKRTRDEGNQVVAVVSAMSGVTDGLIKMARELSETPSERELDVLVATGEQQSIALVTMALHDIGVEAASITGRQAGIYTTGSHTRGRILNIDPTMMQGFLDEGKSLVVAGFQGVTPDGQIHTLGRGGSDLTAIALAAALKADICQIHTDVDGVYTCDPRIVKNARKLPEISYDEMLEMASSGSKVMQSRSVEFAKKYGVVFEVRSSLNDNPGTLVLEEHPDMENVVIRGSLDRALPGPRHHHRHSGRTRHVRQDPRCARGGGDQPRHDRLQHRARRLRPPLVHHALQRPGESPGRAEAGARRPVRGGQDRDRSRHRQALRRRHRHALALRCGRDDVQGSRRRGINIGMISTSEIKIAVTVDETRIEDAARAVHDAFQLDKVPA